MLMETETQITASTTTDNPVNSPQKSTSLPPPIFIKTDMKYNLFCESINPLTQPEGFLCKSSVNGLKLNTYTIDAYRKVVKFLKEKKANFHTYQIRDEKSYRVVIRHLHHSTPIETIKEKLKCKGFTTRNITNVLHNQTKIPLPLFFVDLEPSPINKDIFGIDSLYHTKIKIEEPRPRRNLVQCTRCQSYGHTQAYCNHMPRCVKCGDNHLSSECNKSKDTPATCALCNLPHPANYRGCQVHKDIQKFHRSTTSKTTSQAQNSKPNFFSTSNSSRDTAHQSAPNQLNSPINWAQYKNYLQINTKLGIPLKTAQDLDQASSAFVEMIQSAAKQACHSKNNNSTASLIILDKYPLPDHIKALIRQKRKARAKWQFTGYPNNKRTFNNLINKLKRQLQNHKNQTYDTFISNLDPSNGSLWKASKRILNYIEPTPPLRRSDNSKIMDDAEKANVFVEHLATVFMPNDIQTSPQHSTRVHDFLDSPLPLSMPANSTTPNEVLTHIKRLKNGKAPGYDLITAPFLKQLPHKTIVLLSYIFNSIFRLSYMPSIWKHAQIILIHKPGKPPETPSSYRPISLLPVLGKLFEKLLLKSILKIATDNKIIPEFQFGFKKNHSTVHQLHRVVDHISLAFESKHVCIGVFLDIAQAFDRVWHPGLLFKLKSFLPALYYLLIKSYLNQRTFVTKINGVLSQPQIATAGVPQGSDIAPFLFNVFTNDLPLNPTLY
ncbi:hypothetical protein QTP88_017475 [Uroleucon formosanum]